MLMVWWTSIPSLNFKDVHNVVCVCVCVTSGQVAAIVWSAGGRWCACGSYVCVYVCVCIAAGGVRGRCVLRCLVCVCVCVYVCAQVPSVCSGVQRALGCPAAPRR